MKTTVAVFRLGVILLVLLGMMSPLATAGAGAQTVTCEDFSTREDAQEALEEDPNTAAALDEDGDEIACETLPTRGELADDDRVNLEDVQLPGGDDDPTEEATEDATGEATEEATEEATDEATEEATGDDSGGDVDDYLATIQDEVDSLQESVDRFVEIDEIAAAGDATDAELEDLADEVNEIAAAWADYPDIAAGITATAPDSVEEVTSAYQDLAETTGEAGEEWAVYWDTPSGSAEEEEALEAFNVTFITMQDELAELNLLLGDDPDDARATPEATLEATPEATPEESDGTSGNGEAYIATIQDEVDSLQTSLDDFTAAIDIARDDTSTETEYDEAVDEFNAIAEAWSEYPEVAAGIEAPAGFNEIDEAYQDLAIEVGEMGDNWTLFWEADRNSPEEAEAEAAFTENFDNVQDGIEDLNALLDAMSDGEEATSEAAEVPTEDATEEPAGDATAEPSGDVDTYLTAVRDHADELSGSIDRFNEIVVAGEFTEEEIAEFAEILELWTEAPDVAAEIDAPSAFREIEDAYLELTEELATAAESFAEFSQAEPDSPESRAAFQDFQDAVENGESLAADLDDLLTAEGV